MDLNLTAHHETDSRPALVAELTKLRSRFLLSEQQNARKDLAYSKLEEESEVAKSELAEQLGEANSEVVKLTDSCLALEENAAVLMTDNSNLHANLGHATIQLREHVAKIDGLETALRLVGGEDNHPEVSSFINISDSRKSLSKKSRKSHMSDSESDSSDSDISSSSSSDSDGSRKHKRRSKKVSIKTPAFKPWAGTSQEENVNIFLPRLKEHLKSQNLKKKEMVIHVLPFLEGRAFQLWDLQARTYNKEKKKITWKVFCSSLQKTFGTVEPERLARQQYNALVQKSNVFVFVAEIKKLVQIMKPIPTLCPQESEIINNFLKTCKPELRDWLMTHCPTKYWETSEALFDQAIQWQNNLSSWQTVKTATPAPKTLAIHEGTVDDVTNSKNKSRGRKSKNKNSAGTRGQGNQGGAQGGSGASNHARPYQGHQAKKPKHQGANHATERPAGIMPHSTATQLGAGPTNAVAAAPASGWKPYQESLMARDFCPLCVPYHSLAQPPAFLSGDPCRERLGPDE
jgi:hypothetical protein